MRIDVQNDRAYSPLRRLAQIVGALLAVTLLAARMPLVGTPLASAEEEAPAEESGDDQQEDAGDEGGEDEGDGESEPPHEPFFQLPAYPQPEPEPTAEELAERAKQKREECVAAIERGLRNHWMRVTSDVESFEQYVDNVKEGAQTQLNQISLYTPEDFGDEGFAKLIEDYRKSLNNQIEGIDGMIGDAKLYNEKYVKGGISLRAKVLAELVKSYGLKVDDLYAANLDEALHPNGELAFAVGESIHLTLQQGNIDVTVEGFDHDARSTTIARDKGYLPDGKHVGMLLLTVHNESYALDYEGHPYVELGKIIHTCDASFSSFPAMAISWKYADYELAEGGYLELPAGETKRIAIPYLIDEHLKEALVRVGKKRLVYVKADMTKWQESQSYTETQEEAKAHPRAALPM